ncbi:peptidoglycan recognition family protein [Lactobacillus acetotolerans]|uniref:peptidoglycan recognition family protein n=1 Tax=Lactobacillus acetotolerans TaxID=1600 RepID=UPI002FDA01A2
MSYKIDNTYKLSASEGAPQKASGAIAVFHSTANLDTSAANNAAFEKRTWNSNGAYVHFIVGDGVAYAVGEVGYVAWGAGGSANALSPLQIEMEESSDKAKQLRIYNTVIELLHDYCGKLGIPLTFDAAGTAGVKSHRWCAQYWGETDHTDPWSPLGRIGKSAADVAADLKSGKGDADISVSAGKMVTANVTYALRSLNGSWLDEVTNFGAGDNGYAGVPNHQHDYLTVSVDHGSIKYRVKTAQDGWLGWVTKGDRNDLVNGAAGIGGHAITGVQIVYNTPTGEDYQQAYYRSQTTQRAGWLGVCADDGSVAGFDSWAGMDGEPLDRLQIKISSANPF